MIQMAGKVGYLERVLGIYGPETAEIRPLLHVSIEGLMRKLWLDRRSESEVDPVLSTGQALYSSIHKLAPQNDEQRALKAQALETVADLGKTRWLLFAQADTSIPMPLLIMSLSGSPSFFSFGLFAPTNKTVVVTMIIVSLLVSSALFLILELDRPFDGVIQVSSAPMHNALSQLAP